jgi:class 3 adenylate cyclase
VLATVSGASLRPIPRITHRTDANVKILTRLTLLQLFSLTSLIGVILIGLGLATLVSNIIEQVALDRARDRLADIIRSGADTPIAPGKPALADLPPATFATLHNAPADFAWWDAHVIQMLAGQPIYLVKVWSPDSTVVWTDRDRAATGPRQIGAHHPENADLQRALGGEVLADISSLGKVENRAERQGESKLLELYVPVLARGSFQVLGVFEVYEQIDDLVLQIQEAQITAWQGITVGLGAFYLVLIGIVARASRTITRLQHLQELERYFSPAVARAIAAPDRAQGPPGSAIFSTARGANLNQRLLTRGEISVLFTDIRGFTRQSEQMDAEDVVEMLNAYMDVVTGAVFQHNGSIDKFLGDGVLAVFGAPLPDPNHALDAVRAAQEIRAGLAALNAARRQAGQAPIVIGAAVATGQAVTGNIGSEKQLSFTVTGDTVNLGSRLVGLAAAGEVLITARTYELMQRDAVTGTATGPWRVQGPLIHAVRGREEPATIYVLDGDAHHPALREEEAPQAVPV